MPQIPLYGYIPNPNKPHEGDPLYVLKETQVSPNIFEYIGFIGYGYHEGEFTEEDLNSDRIVKDQGYPVQFIKNDMREIKFVYDFEQNLVKVKTYWRFEMYEEEAISLKKNVITDLEDKHPASYPYFRYPRSKDGIAISRVFDTLFQGRDITVFAPKELMG